MDKKHLSEYISRCIRDVYNDVQFIEQVLLTYKDTLSKKDFVDIQWHIAHLNQQHDDFERTLRNIQKLLDKEDHAGTEI